MSANNEGAGKRKNVLFILTDDQRYNTIHACGNPEIHTPVMDRLVREGTCFSQAHIPGGTSGAVCMPSRAMIHTGRTVFHIQGEGQKIPAEHICMGEAFRTAGYETFGTGKWHNGTESYARSFSCGDNIFFGGMWDHWNVPVCDHDPTGEYDNVIDFVMNFTHNNKTTKIHCDKFHPGKHSSTLLTDTAVSYLDRRGKTENTQPFFLYLAYLAPHDPRTMPEEFLQMYDPEKISLPENYMAEHPFLFGVENIRDEVLASYPRREAEVRRHLAEYYGMISHLDYEIGRVVAKLEEMGELDHTIIVLTGDNGLALGCHGLMGKQNLYDHSVRIPLVLRGPGIPAGEMREQYVYLLDIFPTLCELNGMKIPDSVEGKSFADAIMDATAPGRETLYFVYNDRIRGVKNKRFKLIEYRNTAWQMQLFDLENDPWELENLAGRSEYMPVVDEMRQLMFSYRDSWEGGHEYSKRYWQADMGD